MFVKRYKKPIYWSENNTQFNIEIVCLFSAVQSNNITKNIICLKKSKQ